MKGTGMAKVCALLMSIAFGLQSAAAEYAEETAVGLNDVDWSEGTVRSAASVKRHPATCAFLWGDDKEHFRPEKGDLSIVTFTLRAKKAGRLALTPEFFLMPGTSHWYHLCQGVRVVEPKPACGEAFFPPSRGNGLQIFQQRVTAGQSIVIELVFTGRPKDDKKVQILAAGFVAAAHWVQE